MKRQKVRKTLILISALLFPITMFYYSPYIIIHAALNSVVCGSFILFAGMLVFSIFFGRLFCGYVCAGAGFREMAGCINGKAPKLGWQRFIKYIIWIIWIAIVIGLYIANGGIKYFDPLYATKYGISVSVIEEYPVFYFVILLLFVVPLIWGRGAFCHYLCWMAPFMNFGMKIRKMLHIPGIGINIDKAKCTNCKLCNKGCSMGLNIHKMVQEGYMDENECSMCGECIDNCPQKAITYGLKKSN